MNTKKVITTILASMAIASTTCILNVSAIIQSSQFGWNYWKDNGTSSRDTDSNGNVSYHKTFCMKDGASDTNYHINSEGHFYVSGSDDDAWGYSRAIWENRKGKAVSDSERQWDWGYSDSYATVTSGWGTPYGYEGYTYHGTTE